MSASIANVEHLSDHVGSTVQLRGWVYHRSSKGKLHFVQLRDGTGTVQCVAFQKNVSPELFEALGRCGQESSLILTGEVVADDRAPGGVEVQVSGGEVRFVISYWKRIATADTAVAP